MRGICHAYSGLLRYSEEAVALKPLTTALLSVTVGGGLSPIYGTDDDWLSEQL